MASPHHEGKASHAYLFLLAAALGVLAYVAYWLFYGSPELAASKINRQLMAWVAVLCLLLSYGLGYRQVKAGSVPLGWIAGTAVLMHLAAILIPPFHSTDLYGYINRGWQQLQYGLNPYVFTVDQTLGWEHDPMFTNHWVDNPSPYGFLYLLVAKMLCMPFAGDKAATVMTFKGFNLLLFWATAGLVWSGARQLNARYGFNLRMDLTLLLLLWNPLLIMHALGNGHNDILMGFFITLATWAAIAGNRVWILPALVAATFVKYGAVVILPFAVWWLIRQKAWPALALGMILGIGVFAAIAWPFLGDWQHFQLQNIRQNALVSHSSFHSTVMAALKNILIALGIDEDPVLDAVRGPFKNLLILTYAGFYGWLGWQRFRQPEYPLALWLRDALLVIAVLVCLISPKFYPWYLAMFFPLALFLREGYWLRRIVILLACAQMFGLTFVGQAHMLNYLAMTVLPIVLVLYEDPLRRWLEKRTGREIQA